MATKNNRKTNVWNVHTEINKYINVHMIHYGSEFYQYLS